MNQSASSIYKRTSKYFLCEEEIFLYIYTHTYDRWFVNINAMAFDDTPIKCHLNTDLTDWFTGNFSPLEF